MKQRETGRRAARRLGSFPPERRIAAPARPGPMCFTHPAIPPTASSAEAVQMPTHVLQNSPSLRSEMKNIQRIDTATQARDS